MFQQCVGWPAPHVPPVLLAPDDNGDGRQPGGICAACEAVYAITEARPTSWRLLRFIERMDRDIDERYLCGSQWSERDRQLRLEKING